MGVEQRAEPARLTVQNIGGIDETEVAFEPGVTVLAGRNATNRTSLLQGIMAALGSDRASVKADADRARVELTLDDETYTRTLERSNGSVHADGDPYLEDPTLADLFAFLLGSNEARRAVTTDADLRDLIMRPIDTDEIQSEIDRLVDRRREITDELDELDTLKKRLPELETERTQLDEEIESTKADLEEVEADLEAADADVEQSREEQAELETELDELRERRSELEDVRYDLETEKDSLESLRSERTDVDDEYEALPAEPAGELDDLEARIDQLRTRKQRLETELNELRSVIQFNEEMLDGAAEDLLDDAAGDDVTDELLPDDTVACWTCGSDVEAGQIESTVEKLRDLNRETVGEINDIDDELEDVKERRRELEEQQRRRDRLERRRRELDAEIEGTEERIDDLSDRRTELHEEIEAIEAEVEALENDEYEEILDLHREANQLEYDLGSLESDLERVEDEITTIEDRLDEETDLESRREEINDEVESLRTRIERTEQQAIEEFNNHMDTVLDLLGYENLERIWLERTETRVQRGRRKVSKSVFDLHVVRRTDNGTTYEDTIEHLSESEREVTGLIFALAGYLAHEVYETVPFMLLDSLEAIDSERIATLVDHLRDQSPYLVVALLPEDADALGGRYHGIAEI